MTDLFSVMETASKLPLLKDNYASWRGWKMHMQAILIADDLWELVGLGTEKKPKPILPDGTNAADVKARDKLIGLFDDKVKRAVKVLVTGISGELFYLWDGFPSDPRKLWVDLESHFQTQTHSHRVSIRARLDSLVLKDRENPEKWLKDRIGLYQQYSMSGHAVDETEQCIETLNSLPPSWREFKNMMNFVLGKDLTMTLLMQKAADWHRMNHNPKSNGISATPNQAFNVGIQQRNPNQRRHNQGINKPTSRPNDNRDQPKPVRCYYCKTPGHKVPDCPKKKKQSESTSVVHSETDCSFLGECSKPTDLTCESNVMLADSGATRHMSPCFESFDDFHYFESHSYVKLGDETRLKALGSGSLKFVVKSDDGSDKVCVLNNCLYVPDLRCTLLSVPQVAKRGFRVLFDKVSMRILNSSNVCVLSATLSGKLYKLNCVLFSEFCPEKILKK